MKGRVFSIQRFCTDDGEGIRTTVFLKGCPLRCVWCHNAEGLSAESEIAFYNESCIGCGTCVKACKQSALSLSGGKAAMDREACHVCAACAAACPTAALSHIGETKTVSEVMEIVRRDKIFYGEKGGITLSGGEPMAQPAFALALAKAAQAENISVAVETSGYGRTEDFLSIVPHCDSFLFDCKADSEKHAALVGVEDSLILKNLDAICKRGASVILRCPIVLGANATDAFIDKIITLASRNGSIRAVQLMPYHNTGVGKPVILGKSPQLAFAPPSAQHLASLCQKIETQSGKKTYV